MSGALPQTKRVMVKDEDVCVHCGLCAERCPTAAWDMQKFELVLPTRDKTATGQRGNVGKRGHGTRTARSQRFGRPGSYVGLARAGRAASPGPGNGLGASRLRINDFALKLANVNGTGSASANGLLMQAIFRMGIPVSGKNLFPSNIQGLPTWYEIRVNKDGHTARALDYDLVVAMNSETYARDVKEVRSGGYLLYDSSWPLDAVAVAPRRHLPGRAAGADVQRDLQGLARADPDEEHRLPRRAGRAARHRHARHRRAARREVLEEEGAARVEPQGAARSATTTPRSTSTARCRSGSRRWTRPTTAS